MDWLLVGALQAFDHAVSQEAVSYLDADRRLDMPAMKWIGGSLLYFFTYDGCTDPFVAEFARLRSDRPHGVGFQYLDHLRHSVFKSNMDK